MEFNIFISHSTKESSFGSAIANYLKRIPDVIPFLSEENVIEGSLSESLISKIKTCDVFIVLYSVNSHNSQYVQNEVGVARGSNKPILILAMDNTKPTAMLSGFAYYPLYDPSAEDSLPKVYEYIKEKVKGKADITGLLVFLGFLGGLGLGYFLSRKK